MHCAGHSAIAFSMQGSFDFSIPFFTPAFPSSCISNTSEQTEEQFPQEMQSALLTFTIIERNDSNVYKFN